MREHLASVNIGGGSGEAYAAFVQARTRRPRREVMFL